MLDVSEESAALVGKIQELLTRYKATCATAESCTGGLVAAALTALPGSSSTYLGGVSAYSNDAKSTLLAVPPGLIERFGAVSEAVAIAMAAGVRRRVGSTYAISVTGIAGPGGGSPEKPVGTVFCAVDGPSGSNVIQLALRGTRAEVRLGATLGVLRLLEGEIIKRPDGVRPEQDK